ncbi:MAG: hypothetical protein ACREDK_00340 [Thermoplasmata archaeon]
MSPLWGASRSDRERLLVTLRSLGPTSVAGLSAALSWSERKTERTIREISTRHEAALDFDARARSIGFAVAHGRRPATPPPSPVVEGSIPASGSSASEGPSPPSPSAAPIARTVGPMGTCDACGVRMVPTGTGTTLYCPACGRLATIRRPSATRPAATMPPPSPPPPSPPPSASRHSGPIPPAADDRRAQEMFAAWVTSQPIPCPRCHTPLNHRGVAEYSCPSCGERVHFGGPRMPSATSPARSAAAAPPTP